MSETLGGLPPACQGMDCSDGERQRFTLVLGQNFGNFTDTCSTLSYFLILNLNRYKLSDWKVDNDKLPLPAGGCPWVLSEGAQVRLSLLLSR